MSVTAKILNHTDLLSHFVKRLEEFPAPTQEPTMIYNYNKLMSILQKRELAAIEPDATVVEKSRVLANGFTDITQGIIRNQITDDEFNSKYDKVQARIEDELTGPMYLYAKQWGLSVKALLYYKRARFEKAIDLSLECVILNEHLIKTGIDTLLFRAAEQNKNIVRVFFRQNKVDEGCSLTYSMLSFLFNGATEGLYGTIFSDPKYWNRVPYVREGYAYEFFRVIVSLMMNLERYKGLGERIFRGIFSTLEIDITTPDRQIITDWIEIKKKFYDKDYFSFFELLNEFFEEPLCQIYDVNKISLLLDVCSMAQHSGSTEGANCQRVIMEYIDKYLMGQFYLNTDLSSRNLAPLSA